MTCSVADAETAAEVCYSKAEAWRLAALLEALVDVWEDVVACAAAEPQPSAPSDGAP